MANQPNFAIRMFSTKDWSNAEKAQQFFSLLLSLDRDLIPEKFGPYGQPNKKLSFDRLDSAIEFWVKKPAGSLGFYASRSKPHRVVFWVNWQYQESHRFNELNVWIDARLVNAKNDPTWLIELGNRLYFWGEMDFGQIWCETVSEGRQGKQLEYGLPEIRWANFFGPLYVEFLGREKFVTASVAIREELAGGGYLIAIAENPTGLDYQQLSSYGKIQSNHLGADAFVEKNNPQNNCRVPQFTFSQIALGHPLQVIEYDPIPFAIKDIGQFIHNTKFLAEDLCRRIGPELDYSPASLSMLDDAILKQSRKHPEPFANQASREFFLASVAYYGEVLRRNLGGQWAMWRSEQTSIHPVIVFKNGESECKELVFVRVLELWSEQTREDGLRSRYDLIARDGLAHADKILETLRNRYLP